MNSSKRTTVPLPAIADYLAAVPHLLGFEPQSSIVLSAFDAGRLVLTARIDHPATDDDGRQLVDVIERTLAVAGQHGASSVIVVMYPGDESEVGVDFVTRVCVSACADTRIELIDLLVNLSANMFTSTMSGNDVVASLVAPDALTAQGRAIAPTREHLGDVFDNGNPDPVVDVLFDSHVSPYSDDRALEDALVMYLTSPLDVRLCPADVAAFALGIHKPTVREPAMVRIMTANDPQLVDQAVTRMITLVRDIPDFAAAPATALLGAFAWGSGDGAFADVAAVRAAKLRPGLPLASLVSTAARSGTHPEVFISVLLELPLSTLRGEDPPAP